MPARVQTAHQAKLACVGALVAALASGGLAAAAMLAPAPAAVVPLLCLICVLCPLFAAWELRAAVAVLQSSPSARHERAVAKLRRGLARLPETEHPLGL